MRVHEIIITMKIIAKNRRATYDIAVEDRLIAGVVLTGAETKSIRLGQVQLKGSYVTVKGGELWWINGQVSPYKYSAAEHEPKRTRKLLVSKKELSKISEFKTSGRTLVPLALGLQRNRIKIEVGIGMPKKTHDKRHDLRAREANKSIVQKF